MLKPVVQEESTGCGIAAVANILGKTYSDMKAIANRMDIYASDESLWSDTQYVRRMLKSSGVKTSPNEIPFTSWDQLPDLALLSIKFHYENNRNFWHWVVFKRENGQGFVLDSASYLSSNIRTDFEEMQPKWFIEVNNTCHLPVPFPRYGSDGITSAVNECPTTVSVDNSSSRISTAGLKYRGTEVY